MTININALPAIVALKLAGLAGFEPAHDEIKTRCLTAWRQPNLSLGTLPEKVFTSHEKHFLKAPS